MTICSAKLPFPEPIAFPTSTLQQPVKSLQPSGYRRDQIAKRGYSIATFTVSALSFCSCQANVFPTNGCGTMFELSPNRGGGCGETVLDSFGGGNGEGGYRPLAGLIIDHTGNLYGANVVGGIGISLSARRSRPGLQLDIRRKWQSLRHHLLRRSVWQRCRLGDYAVTDSRSLHRLIASDQDSQIVFRPTGATTSMWEKRGDNVFLSSGRVTDMPFISENSAKCWSQRNADLYVHVDWSRIADQPALFA